MTTIADARPDSLTDERHHPRVECTDWCQYGDGHPNPLFAADQTCMSGHPPIHTVGAEVGAYAIYRHVDERSSVAVYLMPQHGHGREERLTVRQARALAAQLTACCDLIAGGTR